MKDIIKFNLCVCLLVLKNFYLCGMSISDIDIMKENIICNGDCEEVCNCKKCKCCSVCSNFCNCFCCLKDYLLLFLI